MNGQIFISYRRGDSLGSTGRIYDRLLDHFPKEQIFMDVDTIPPGEDFIDAIERAVSCCDVLLAVIGRDWLHMKDRFGRRMLENEADFVRAEIRAALQRNVKVIPILVEDAEVPSPEDLPEDIKALARKNAIELRHTGFHADVDRLIKAVQKVVKEEEEKAKLKAEQKRLRREQLHEQEKETAAWRQAVQENSLSSYATYLNSYPQGKCAEEANVKIKTLQKDAEEKKKEQAFTHYYQQGIEAFEHGLFSESLSHFHEALKLRPDNKECKTWVDNCQSEIDRIHVEEQQKKEAEQKRKEEEAIIKKQQELQLRREQEKRLEEERIKAKALELEKQGDKLKKSKDFKAALALYEQALKLAPGSKHSLQALASCQEEIQKKEEQERAMALEEEERKSVLPQKKNLFSNHWLIVGVCIAMIGLVSFLIFGTKNNAADNKNLTAQKTKAIITESNKREDSNLSVTTENPISKAVSTILQQMVPIDGGQFEMGNNKTKIESPAHTVSVNSFLLSKYEITRQQWNTVMGAARYTTSLNAPATNVSWDEVQLFIEKLNKASGKVFRLPTESEWEYACLKGHSDDYRQKINAYSWNAGNSGDSLHEVGLKLPNALGIYDMLGNAYEWCSDAYGKYQSEQKDDSRRMLRGSDFKTRPEIISPKRRNWNQRTKPTERIGFRLAMDK